jgi:hypothetical protein
VNRGRWGPRSSERHPWCTRKCPRLTQRYKPLTWTDVFKGQCACSRRVPIEGIWIDLNIVIQTIILITIVLGLLCQKIVSFATVF